MFDPVGADGAVNAAPSCIHRDIGADRIEHNATLWDEIPSMWRDRRELCVADGAHMPCQNRNRAFAVPRTG
jgi:hypothetical protein